MIEIVIGIGVIAGIVGLGIQIYIHMTGGIFRKQVYTSEGKPTKKYI